MARDDFTQKTKELVAKRVAYRCCFKGCGIATIGPKYGDALRTSNVGVGCHICAASPNGPRYDPTMTTEERISPKNCIWMCENHSKIIDADEKAYPRELLHQWKDEAEKEAVERLKDYQYKQEELSDKNTLESIFNALIRDGQYDTLILLIKNHEKYNAQDELLLRYEIYYNCYCNIDAISFRIKHYLEKVAEKRCDDIIKVLISLKLKQGLQELIPYCQDIELKQWAEAVLNDDIESVLMCPPEKTNEYKEYKINNQQTASKLLSSFIVDSKIPVLPNQIDGSEFVLYEKEFIFKARASAWRVFCESVRGKYYIKERCISEDYIFLKGCIGKIIQLDKEWQIFIWSACLNYIMNEKSEFEQIYHFCPDYIKENILCKRICWEYNVTNKLVSPEDYLSEREVLADEASLIMVLRNLHHETRLEFLDSHRYLYNSNSIFLYFWLRDSNICDQEKYQILLKYKELYFEDVLWNTMVAYYAAVDEGIEYLRRAQSCKDEMQYATMDLYIAALPRYGEWEELKSLFSNIQDNTLRYAVVLALCTNKTLEYRSCCIEFFKRLESDGFYEKRFYRNIAVLLCQMGDMAAAQNYYEKEYALDPDNSVLRELLQTKYQRMDYSIDKYVKKATTVCDADLQCAAAAFYEQNHDPESEKKYLIRTLILSPQKAEALHGLAVTSLEHPDEDKFKFGKIFNLENQSESLFVAALSGSLIDGLPYNTLAGCEIINENDFKYISWKLSAVGDDVNYKGHSYKIKEISSFSEKLYAEAWASFMKDSIKDGNLTLIEGNSPADAVREITKIVENRRKGQEEILEIFNQKRGILPISILAKQLGIDYYTAWGHIISENKLKINNYSKGPGKCFILSKDAICTLAMLDALKVIDLHAVVIAKQMKFNISAMFSSRISDLQKNTAGTLHSEKGQIYRTDYSRNYKKDAITFFVDLLEFIDKIKDIEAAPYICKNKDMLNVFLRENLSAERSLLGLAQSDKDYAIICDEPFICTICDFEKIPHISTIDFLFQQNLSHEDILKYLKMLDDLNFLNYFSAETYKKIIDSIRDIGDESRKIFWGELKEWLVPENHSKEHSRKVLNVWRDLYAENPQSFYSHSLSGVGRFYFSELYPEKYKEIIDKLKNIRIEFILDVGADEE